MVERNTTSQEKETKGDNLAKLQYYYYYYY